MKTRSSGSAQIFLAIAGLTAGSALGQNAKPQRMPYTAEDHAQFVPASQAAFLSDSDVLIGVSKGGVAKAYPAADVGQHGVVHDQMPDGPIAVSW